MPALEKYTPSPAPKSMANRRRRAQVIMEGARVSLPGRMILDARREMAYVHTLALRATDAQEISTLMGTACRIRDQLADLLSLPKRPASAPAGSRGTIPVSAQVLDAVLSPLDPPNP